MAKKELDILYFYACFGDQNAYVKLQNEFVRLGRTIAGSLIKELNVLQLKDEDLLDDIYELFINAVNTYDPSLAKFSTYSGFILERRLKHIILDRINKGQTDILSLDLCEDEKPLIETIEDKNLRKIVDDISVDNFKFQMSSKSTPDDKLGAIIASLLYTGYSKKEISDMLHMPIYRVRYLLKKKAEKLDNMKLELK